MPDTGASCEAPAKSDIPTPIPSSTTTTTDKMSRANSQGIIAIHLQEKRPGKGHGGKKKGKGVYVEMVDASTQTTFHDDTGLKA